VDFRHSERSRELTERVSAFVRERVARVEHEVLADPARRSPDWSGWAVPDAVRALKDEARAAGLWNLFLPAISGLSNVEYAPVAEAMGHSLLAPEIMNCNAPDTGNMEILELFGSAEQKSRFLDPLLRGETRSGFGMTEPEVASSDATNMQATIRADGEDVVVDGTKWWTTGLGHPDLAFVIVMGVSDAQADRHGRHSMVVVPKDTPGLTIRRMLPVFGDYDAPYGHGEMRLEGVRVPRANVLGELGAGFAIAQGRLGPGRIHHCMRCIGAAERALALMIARGLSREAFGKPLLNLGGNRERIADLRIAIDQARLLTLHAAWRLDELGAMGALADISMVKVVAPSVLQRVADEAIQMFGAAGLSDDTPLPSIFALARILRIADGPDAVHRGLIAKIEIGKHSGR
jgi:alkylation response protein AidB-like acyl-CoA dehydrogenase